MADSSSFCGDFLAISKGSGEKISSSCRFILSIYSLGIGIGIENLSVCKNIPLGEFLKQSSANSIFGWKLMLYFWMYILADSGVVKPMLFFKHKKITRRVEDRMPLSAS